MNNTLEGLQAGRDRFNASRDGGSNPDFYYGCARLSLWLPIIGGIFCKGMETAMRGAQGEVYRWLALGTAGVFVLLTLASVVLGIIALFGVATREGILARAISGILFSVILLSIFIPNFYHGRQNAVLARTVDDSVEKMKAGMAKDIQTGKGISMDQQQRRLASLKASVDSVSQNASGNEALIARAGSSFLTRIQMEAKNYGQAAKPIQNGAVFDLSGVTKREQLQAKRDQVKAFMAANEHMLAFATNQETVFKEELAKQPLSSEVRESALNGFHKTFAIQKPLQEKIRNDDRRCGVAMLGMLDLLDANWGKWTYNDERKKVVFDDAVALDKYIDFQDEIQAAAREQVKFQKQLLGAK